MIGRRSPSRRDATVMAPVPPQHDRKDYPVPADWTVNVDPSGPRLAAGEETVISVRISPPTGFTGRKSFNINAFSEIGLEGGVTLHVDARPPVAS